MAIIFEEQNRFNWKALLTVLAIVAVISVAVYYLFFVPVPVIEVIIPVSVKTASELSSAEFDPSVVVNSESFRSLRRYAGEPSSKKIGRDNPFRKF